MNDFDNNSNYACSINGGRSHGKDNTIKSNNSNSEGNWESLRHLLSDFHELVNVELSTLLQRTTASEEHDEISRHYFDLRRCFRNMQELLLRDDLLNMLDQGDNQDDETDELDTRSCSSYFNANKKDLLDLFANDLVQLSSLSFFDNTTPGSPYNDAIGNSGVRELYRSLIVLASNRFPIKATLNDDQISLLLTKVLSLIQQETALIHQKFGQERQHHEQNCDEDQCHRLQKDDFEPLQSLLSWLNTDMTAERLSRGVLLDSNEAAMALRIPLEFWNEHKNCSTMLSSSTTNPSHAIQPPELFLSLRILIDSLLGALNSLVRTGNDGRSNGESITIDDTIRMGAVLSLSLREWMLMSHQHCEQDEYNAHLCLLRLIDRYTLELVEETLDLLGPNRRKTLQGEFAEHHKLVAKQKQDSRGYRKSRHDSPSRCPDKTANLTKQRRKRVVKVLQHAAMTTSALLIMETSEPIGSSRSAGTNGTTLVFAGLSRSFWRSFARFIAEEVDCLCDNENDGVPVELTTVETAEECQIAATDVLFRLTKTHVQTILFYDQHNKKSRDSDGSNRLRDTKVKSQPPARLSQEEFSIVLATILRLLAHPNDYWTAKHQAWVAKLLRWKGDNERNDLKSANKSCNGDIASKLRKALQAAAICSSYTPDALSLEEQRRVESSLEALLLSSSNRTSTKPKSHRKRKHVDDCSEEAEYDGAGETTRGGETTKLVSIDPWELFWAIRQ